MSLVAFRRDTEDPDIVKHFADLVGIEERLKMLCLLTLVDIEAVSLETLTPWREELLWRLYVDTYNHLTLSYGDERIRHDQSSMAELLAGRPPDVPETEIRRFLEGLPCRYLQLFDHDVIYRHVQLSRDIQPDHVHAALERKGATWELTVVTLDKPVLFSNICGVLSSFGMDILKGHAMTNPNGLVLDIFQFTDDDRYLELNKDGRERVLEVLAGSRLGPPRRHRASSRPRNQRPASRQGSALRPGHPRRQSFIAALHDSGYHRQQRDRAAASNQPGDLPSWLQRRAGPDFNRRREGDRRVPHHRGRGQAVGCGAGGVDRRPATHAGGKR